MFRVVRNLVQKRNPQILFLSETKTGEEMINRIKVACRFDGCLTVKSRGVRGGLCLLWKEQNSVLVLVQSFSQNHIDSEVIWKGKKWRFMGIYGFLEASQKASISGPYSKA